MKNKLKFLVKHGIKKKFSSKYFKVVNIILLLLIPAILNIDRIIEYFGGEFSEPTNIYVVDNASAYESFEAIYNQSTSYSIVNSDIILSKSDKTTNELVEKIKADRSKNIVIELENDLINIFNAKIISYDYIDTLLYQNIITTLNSAKSNIALQRSDIDLNELENIYKTVEVDRTLLNKELDENSEFMTMISNILIPAFIIPFFFLIILVVQSIGAEINEEKTSKSMEIIISSVSPKTHFLSKIIATNIFVLTQGLLFLVYSVIGIIIRTKLSHESFMNSFGLDISQMIDTFLQSTQFTNMIYAIPFVIIILLLSFLAYSLVAGILASMTTSIEDYQQIQTPIMILMLAGYYLAIISSAYDSATFIKFISYIPFISSILSPVLLIIGQIGIVDILISTGLLLLTCFLLIKYGLKVYKVGILNYSSSKLWKKMLKAVKEK